MEIVGLGTQVMDCARVRLLIDVAEDAPWSAADEADILLIRPSPAWRAPVLAHLRKLQFTLAVGNYAVRYHFPEAKGSLADIVSGWREHWPRTVPLPHPSPRNLRWFKLNPWFEREVLPHLT